jgi:hypothetical protein
MQQKKSPLIQKLICFTSMISPRVRKPFQSQWILRHLLRLFLLCPPRRCSNTSLTMLIAMTRNPMSPIQTTYLTVTVKITATCRALLLHVSALRSDLSLLILPMTLPQRSVTIAKQLNLNANYVVSECGMRCECPVGYPNSLRTSPLTLSHFAVISRKCCRRVIGKGLSWNLHIFIHSKRLDSEKRRSFLLLDEEISDSDTYLPISTEEESHEVSLLPSPLPPHILSRKSCMEFERKI